MPPKLNRERALFVLGKIDELLAWKQRKENECDTKFVELGRYLCEVRAGQYWRVEKLKSFDEFLERRLPESRRKAYYLMSTTSICRHKLWSEYRADWFDPRNGTWQPVGKGSLQSNEIGIIMLPQFPAENDWGLRLTYAGPIPAAERRIPDEY